VLTDTSRSRTISPWPVSRWSTDGSAVNGLNREQTMIWDDKFRIDCANLLGRRDHLRLHDYRCHCESDVYIVLC
jgi:hypothetical protein